MNCAVLYTLWYIKKCMSCLKTLCNVLSLTFSLCCVVFHATSIVMLQVSVSCSCRVLLCVVNTLSGQCATVNFRTTVNVYCDRDISCMVIVTNHVLISVQLVSYVASIQCRLISLRFTSIDKTSNSFFVLY